MGVLIYIIFALLAAGIVVLCVFMLKKEIKNYKQEKEEKQKEEQEKQLESDVKEAISNRV
jgi:flagellar basal body-associated protein FliL